MSNPKFEVELYDRGQFVNERFGNEYLGGRTMEDFEYDLDY